MRKSCFNALAVAAILLFIFTGIDPAHAAANQANQAPQITVWYETSLKFGQLGNPQTHVNILGNVQDADGLVSSLTYRLNSDNPVTLSIGPDGERLANAGDFNAAILTSRLLNGNNALLFAAVDNSGATSTKTVTVNYTRGENWPLPYSTNWTAAGSIHDQAQVLDGLWSKGSGGIQPTVFAYDRLVAIGDINWQDFEILAPITVRGFHPNPANPNDAGGVGVIARWQGHIGSGQPPDNWTRLGAYGYYSNRLKALALRLNGNEPATQSFSFRLNTTYLFKLRVETVAQGGRYSFKLWEQGQPEPSWGSSSFANLVNVVDSNGDLLNGSVLLVAHRVDATFGNVTVCPLNQNYSLAITQSGSGSVTAQPAKTSYACGEGVTLTAQASPGWAFTGWSGDLTGQSNPISFNMTKSLSATANFSLRQELPYKSFLPSILAK